MTAAELAEKLEDIAGYRDIVLKHRKITDDKKITYVLKDGTRIHEDESVIAKLAASLTAALESAAETATEAAARLRSMEEALKPFAEVARLEELHGSTLGHRDIPDKQISAVDFQNERGHLLSIRGPEMGDFRKARAALSGEGQ